MRLGEMDNLSVSFIKINPLNHSQRLKQGSEHRRMLMVTPDAAQIQNKGIKCVLVRFYDIASCLACTGNLLIISCLHLM